MGSGHGGVRQGGQGTYVCMWQQLWGIDPPVCLTMWTVWCGAAVSLAHTHTCTHTHSHTHTQHTDTHTHTQHTHTHTHTTHTHTDQKHNVCTSWATVVRNVQACCATLLTVLAYRLWHPRRSSWLKQKQFLQCRWKN